MGVPGLRVRPPAPRQLQTQQHRWDPRPARTSRGYRAADTKLKFIFPTVADSWSGCGVGRGEGKFCPQRAGRWPADPRPTTAASAGGRRLDRAVVCSPGWAAPWGRGLRGAGRAGSREPVALCRHLGRTPRSPKPPSPAPRAPLLGLSFPCGSWGARRRGLTGRGRGGARSGRARGRGCRPTAGFAGSGWARCRLGSGWAPAPRASRKRRCGPAPPAGGHVGSGRGPGRSRGGVAGRPRPAGPGGGRACGEGGALPSRAGTPRRPPPLEVAPSPPPPAGLAPGGRGWRWGRNTRRGNPGKRLEAVPPPRTSLRAASLVSPAPHLLAPDPSSRSSPHW